ncbi:MAG: hypothetical protein Q4E99_01320 [Bacillota bacterium]|nr:hypothetical protein [Bacillota bacterium]
MTYTNGFTISANNNECVITFLETIPGKQDAKPQEISTFVMNEQIARQLINALSQVYAKIDSDRASKSGAKVSESISHIN